MQYVDGHGDVEEMTLPDERYRAVRRAEQFLSSLASGDIPHVPRVVRDEARSILRHYPGQWDMDRAAVGSPDVFQQRMEDLTRFIRAGEQAAQQRGDSDRVEQQQHNRGP
jgi:hypothetical protein